MHEKPSVLLLSNRDDLTTDFVATRLREKEYPYLRINSEDIIERPFCFVPGQRMETKSNEKSIDLSSIRSVYFRRVPSVFLPDDRTTDRNFVNRERKEFIEGLALALNAEWMNPLQATLSGERKLHQLQNAARIGLKTPKTIITNDVAEAKSFTRLFPKVIAKPISHGFTIEEGEAYSIYTNEIEPTAFDSLDSIIEVPIFLQERVENKCDIRVTIVGETVFSVAIEKDDRSVVDWRRPGVKKRYSNCQLPDGYLAQLKALNHELGLVYSAIDLIQRQNDDLVFLEVNPVGEWLWLELELGLPISQEILKWLMKKG